MEALIKAVREYAQAHYNESGWDFIVECWDDADIQETIGEATTPAQAIQRIAKQVKMVNEYRNEIRETVW